MKFAKLYRMTCKEGAEARFEQALASLAGALKAVPGCDEVTVLQDSATPTQFLFLERWRSAEAYQCAAPAMPRESFAPVMAALADKPEVRAMRVALTC